MFLDDERFPTTPDWFVARNSYHAIKAVELYGMPYEIAFDHDLGGDDNAMIFVRKLELMLDAGEVELPDDFSFSIHSQNPIGAKNIQSYMNQIIDHYKS